MHRPEVCLPAPAVHALQAFQIITHVQSHVQANGSGSGLVIPAPQELPAGLFPSYRDLCDLMQACWARDPAQRPTFAEIVQRLRCGAGYPLVLLLACPKHRAVHSLVLTSCRMHSHRA